MPVRFELVKGEDLKEGDIYAPLPRDFDEIGRDLELTYEHLERIIEGSVGCQPLQVRGGADLYFDEERERDLIKVTFIT